MRLASWELVARASPSSPVLFCYSRIEHVLRNVAVVPQCVARTNSPKSRPTDRSSSTIFTATDGVIFRVRPPIADWADRCSSIDMAVTSGTIWPVI